MREGLPPKHQRRRRLPSRPAGVSCDLLHPGHTFGGGLIRSPGRLDKRSRTPARALPRYESCFLGAPDHQTRNGNCAAAGCDHGLERYLRASGLPPTRALHRWRVAGALASLLALGTCVPSDPTGSRPRPDSALLVRADVSGTTVATVIVDVAAPDITPPLVFSIPVTGAVALGTITLPAGFNRTITVRAYDTGGVATHTGSVTVAIQPGSNPTISVVLAPLTSTVSITVTLGSFAVDVTPAFDSLKVGDTVSLTATILDAYGHPIGGQVDWGSVAPAVVTVVSAGAQAGRVAALRPGRTTVMARFGGAAGKATLTVAGWYASPTGSTGADGSSRPWDLQTALDGGDGKVQPGDTIWLRGGTYRGSFTSTLSGSAAAPTVVRPYPGERVTLDGAGSTRSPLIVDGTWTVFSGLEITNSDAVRVCADCLGLRPAGVYIRYASNVKLINLVVHDVGHGVYTEDAAPNIEISGWIIYNGGNTNASRSDGHGIYIENDGLGTKVARDNVIFNMFGLGIHGYTDGIGHALRNITLDGNVTFNNGVLSGFASNGNLLLGSPVDVADNDLIRANMAYYSPTVSGFLAVELGQDTLHNGTLTFRDNYIAAGGNDALTVGSWGQLQVQDNTLLGTAGMVKMRDTTAAGWVWSGNQYWRDPGAAVWRFGTKTYTLADWQAATGLGATDHAVAGPPTQPRVFVRANRYEPGRANVVIYNWPHLASVAVDLTGVLTQGDRFEVHNVQDLWGTAVLSGSYGGGLVGFPMIGVTPPQPIGGSPVNPIQTGPDFDVFLVTRIAP